jgi:MinD superfamily P-loop ATPase
LAFVCKMICYSVICQGCLMINIICQRSRVTLFSVGTNKQRKVHQNGSYIQNGQPHTGETSCEYSISHLKKKKSVNNSSFHHRYHIKCSDV